MAGGGGATWNYAFCAMYSGYTYSGVYTNPSGLETYSGMAYVGQVTVRPFDFTFTGALGEARIYSGFYNEYHTLAHSIFGEVYSGLDYNNIDFSSATGFSKVQRLSMTEPERDYIFRRLRDVTGLTVSGLTGTDDLTISGITESPIHWEDRGSYL